MAERPHMGWNICVVTVRAGVVLAACVLVLDMARPAPVHGGDQPRSRWWLNPAVQQELGLTKAQVQALQRTFERGLAERLALRRDLDRLDSQLQRLLERGEEDDGLVERFSARVEEVRAQRNVRRTLILLEMYRILTPAQRLAFSRLRAPDAAQMSGFRAPSAAAPR
jgi:Spy/CpxP family protein refolding chaperone